MKIFVVLLISFCLMFGAYFLIFSFTLEDLVSYKVIEPLVVALGVTSITYFFSSKK